MDEIQLRGLRVVAHHGLREHERRDGQPFVIDVTLERDLAAAAASDDLADTTDYGALAGRLAQAARATRFDLIEALAGHLAEVALREPGVTGVTVRVAKPRAPVPEVIDEVAVVVRRTR